MEPLFDGLPVMRGGRQPIPGASIPPGLVQQRSHHRHGDLPLASGCGQAVADVRDARSERPEDALAALLAQAEGCEPDQLRLIPDLHRKDLSRSEMAAPGQQPGRALERRRRRRRPEQAPPLGREGAQRRDAADALTAHEPARPPYPHRVGDRRPPSPARGRARPLYGSPPAEATPPRAAPRPSPRRCAPDIRCGRG